MPETPELIALAERLGYHRAWVFDTPALQLDVWMTLALAADRTTAIGLGPGVLIPSLRHPMVTASAIAHLTLLAPGRVEIGVGTGFTGRLAMGQRPLPWSEVTASIRTIQALLRGETTEVEGRPVRMLHWPDQAPPRPIDVPWRLGVAGPKGTAAALELGCGLFVSRPPRDSLFAPLPAGITATASGTVLRPGEDASSPRVIEAAGPGMAVSYHMLTERPGATARSRLAALPNGDRFGELVAAVEPDARASRIHEGHLTRLNALDRQVVDSAAIGLSPLLHRREEVPEWLKGYDAMGVTEVAYIPVGDQAGELTELAQAARLTPRS